MSTDLLERSVAKKKPPEPVPDEPAKRLGRPKSETGTRDHALVVRCREGWKGWTLGLAEFCREDTSDLVDHALVEYARLKGYQVPPPKR